MARRARVGWAPLPMPSTAWQTTPRYPPPMDDDQRTPPEMAPAGPSDGAPQTLYLIDGHAQFFRAYHAMRASMTSPVTGEPTHLTYTFMAMLIKLLRDDRPDYLAVVIDASGDQQTFRSEIYPEYKANRDATPEDFGPQVQRCLELLEQMQIPVIAQERVEADDVIATLVKRLPVEHPNLHIRIVSRDKDLTQLITDRVEMFDAMKDQVITPDAVFKTDGVQPRHVGDILALMGDTSDNIPGVPGIGPKTAAKLILEYESLDNLLSHLDEIKGKRRENLEAHRDQIPMARQLVDLKDDLDAELDLESARVDLASLPVEQIVQTLRDLGFTRHQDDLRALVGANTRQPVMAAGDSAAAVSARAQGAGALDDGGFGGLFDQTPGHEPVKPQAVLAYERGDYQCITTHAALDEWIERIRTAGYVAVDTETDSLSPVSAALCGISMAVEAGRAAYIPVRSPRPNEHLDQAAVLAALRPILEDDAITKIGHNLKYDMNVLRASGINMRGPMFDTMTASYVVDATRSSHRLEYLARAFLAHECIPITDVLGKGRTQRTFDQAPLDIAVPYAAEDADITLRLRDVLHQRLDELGLTGLFNDIELPLVHVLAELEFNGIRVEPDELIKQEQELTKRAALLRQEIIDAAPVAFNPDSPQQLAEALFNQADDDTPGLGLKPLKRGKTGPSTDIEVMEKLAADPSIDSPIPTLIVEYRQLTKLVNTYLVALREAINPKTGRVHASFHQTGTATGRLSSSDPNLQNIPIRSDVGREIRRAFVAEPGNVLLTADYSQIELRMLAHLSGDPALIEAFESGEDIHTAVAAEVYGVAPGDVTREQRSNAKMVNFGIVYGITAFGLARRLGPDVGNSQAQQIIDDYKARFTSIDTFLDACKHKAITDGYVETILGRRRAIPQITDRNPMRRSLGERMAINTVVQGSAADLIKLAMIDVCRALPGEMPDVRMILQIHDELVFEVPQQQADRARLFVVDHMENAMQLRVPLVVEAAWAANWVDAK